jgi:hypothetical protein
MEEIKRQEILARLEKGFYLNTSKKGMLDALQEKIVSRKLFVFLVSTGLLAWSALDSDTWGMIAIIYIGGQSVVDVAKVWRTGN